MEKQYRGFAAMSKEKRVAIARLGGYAVPDECRSFSRNKKLASRAGRKGANNRWAKEKK